MSRRFRNIFRKKADAGTGIGAETETGNVSDASNVCKDPEPRLVKSHSTSTIDASQVNTRDGELDLSRPTDNSALGLEILVEGENAIVEYVL